MKEKFVSLSILGLVFLSTPYDATTTTTTSGDEQEREQSSRPCFFLNDVASNRIKKSGKKSGNLTKENLVSAVSVVWVIENN